MLLTTPQAKYVGAGLCGFIIGTLSPNNMVVKIGSDDNLGERQVLLEKKIDQQREQLQRIQQRLSTSNSTTGGGGINATFGSSSIHVDEKDVAIFLNHVDNE